jgi:hypothetical protein
MAIDSSGARFSRSDVAAAALALLTVAASRWIAVTVFEDLPHLEDEFAYLWQAQVMAGGEIALSSPPEPESFLVPFVVDHRGLRFGKYPPGWPAALTVGVSVDAAGWVNPLLAGLAAWLTYRLASRLAGPAAGVLAALLTGASPMVLMLAGSLMPHMLTMVLTVAWGLAWFDLFSRGQGGSAAAGVRLRLLVAGLCLGLLALTRPLTAGAVAIPFAVHAQTRLALRRLAWRRLVASGLIALAVAALVPVWQWALTGDAGQSLYELWWAYDRLGFGPGIGVLPEGHSLYQAWINTRQSLSAMQHDLFGWPYLSWLFVPIGLWALRRRAEAWICLGVFPSLVVSYLAYWVSSWVLGPRYYAESVPMLAVLSAAGVAWLAGGSAWRRRLATALLAVLLAGGLTLYLPIRVGGLRGLYRIDRASLESFAAVAPEQGLVIVERNPHWHGYGNLLTLTPPFAESELLLALDRGPSVDDRLRAEFPGLPFYRYAPDDPGRLNPLPPG